MCADIIPEGDGYIIQKISDDPIFEDVERYIKPTNLLIDWENKTIIFAYQIIFVKNDINVTSKFAKNYSPIIANNERLITPRNELGELIEETEEYEDSLIIDGVIQYDEFMVPQKVTKERIKKYPMFDYLIKMVQQNVAINTLIMGFILENDVDGYFNAKN